MTELAYIVPEQADYDPRLRTLLDGTGIDPHEFIGLDYFSLVPFFVLAGATVAPDAHAHGDSMHVTAVRVSVADGQEDAFLATLEEILADAYEGTE
jgi:hypothetical protein